MKKTSYLKSSILLMIVLVWTALCSGQNLVPNPYFEEYTACPTVLGEIHLAPPWTNGNDASVDYFNACADPWGPVGVPDNWAGHQESLSGQAYAGVAAGSMDQNDYREYLMAPLISPLVEGQSYLVSFYISLGEVTCPIVPFGALFTIGPPEYTGTDHLDYIPQIETNGEMLNNWTGWTLISRCFIANGGEDYITLGNFHDLNNTAFDTSCWLPAGFHGYFYVEDVSVVEMPLSESEFTMDPVTVCGSYTINPGDAENYHWNDGTTNPTLTVTESGTYYVTLSNECELSYGEIEVTIIPDAPPVVLPNDTLLCPGESIEIILDTENGSYEWQDGSSESEYTITQEGEYVVSLTDGCDVTSDTINVSFLQPPEPFSLGEDLVLCEGYEVTLTIDPLLGDFEWQDGSNASSFTIEDEGIYALTITNACGEVEDEIEVEFLEPIVFSLGPDEMTLCAGSQIEIELDASLGDFLWSDGSNGNSFTVTEPGLVSVTISNACFEATDQILVVLMQAPVFTLGPDLTVCTDQLPVTLDMSDVPFAQVWQWNDGDFEPTLNIIEGGTYSVTISNTCFSISDDINITIADADPAVTLPPDQLLCTGQTLVLDADGLMGTYQWITSTGSVSDADTFLVTEAGTVYLTVTNICGSGSDSVNIYYTPPLTPPDLGFDFSLCPGEIGVLHANTNSVNYLWSTATDTLSTADSLIVSNAGTYFLQISDACTSASDTIVITSNANPPDVDLPEPFPLCAGDSVVIDAGITGVQYQWEGGTSLSSLIISEPGIYSLTVTNACGTDIDSVQIEDGGNTPLVSLGGDVELCPGDSVILIPQSMDVDTWMWQDGTIEPQYIAALPGTYHVQGFNQCGITSDTIVVTLLPDIPALDLGSDLSICPGETITLSITEPDVEILWNDQSTGDQFVVDEVGLVFATISNACGSSSDTVVVELLPDVPVLDLGEDKSLCPGETITLDPGIADVTYLWQDGSNASTFQTAQPGTIILIISNACGLSTDTIEIIEDTNGPQLDLGPDILACQGDTVILEAGITGVEYLWSNGCVASQCIATISGVYSLMVSNACGSAMDTIVVDIHGTTPTPSLGVDTTLCDEEVLILLSTADAETDIEWSDGSDTPSLMVSGAGIYILYESNHCGSASDTIEVSYQSAPVPFDLGEDVVLCPGDSIVLNAPVTMDLITWQDASTGSVSTGSITMVSTATTITLLISNQCGEETDEISIAFDSNQPIVDLGEPVSLCPDASVTLDAGQTFIATYLWSTGSQQSSIIATHPDNYAVTVSTECYSASDNVLIESNEDCEDHDLFIPNIFSPNRDNINDEWRVIPNDPDIIGMECRIFDRWGDLIFGTREIPIIWDGSSKGKEMHPGVYVYLIVVKKEVGESDLLSGDITLIR